MKKSKNFILLILNFAIFTQQVFTSESIDQNSMVTESNTTPEKIDTKHKELTREDFINLFQKIKLATYHTANKAAQNIACFANKVAVAIQGIAQNTSRSICKAINNNTSDEKVIVQTTGKANNSTTNKQIKSSDVLQSKFFKNNKSTGKKQIKASDAEDKLKYMQSKIDGSLYVV